MENPKFQETLIFSEGCRSHDCRSQPGKEITRAFRLATDWSVDGRWEAFQNNVFQQLLARFKEEFRPHDFSDSDFQRGEEIDAWQLSPAMKTEFLEFLKHGSGGSNTSKSRTYATPTEERQQSEQQNSWWDSSTWWEDSCNSWWENRPHEWTSSAWRHAKSCESKTSWAEPWDSWELSGYHKQALDGLGLNGGGTLQSAMIHEFLRAEKKGKVLAGLDPARDPDAEWHYRHLIEQIEISELKYSHQNISERFLHGDQQGQSIHTLTDELYSGKLGATDVRPLVAVRWHGQVYVICGNRRCKAMKDFIERLHPWRWGLQKARVIVHEFPNLPGIQGAKWKALKSGRLGLRVYRSWFLMGG